MSTDTATESRFRELAQSLDCLTEHDLTLLTDTAPATLESWRKRGKGPAYILAGNRYLYPRHAVAEYLKANIRGGRAGAARGTL
jgi:hypothetical protein